jgi:hypothetical protein
LGIHLKTSDVNSFSLTGGAANAAKHSKSAAACFTLFSRKGESADHVSTTLDGRGSSCASCDSCATRVLCVSIGPLAAFRS